MNLTQMFGIALITIAMLLLVVFPIFGIFAGEEFIEFSIVGGWAISIIGSAIIIGSLIFERMSDIKKEKFKKY